MELIRKEGIYLSIYNNMVTIITPMYNDANFIEETIESVLKQTYKDFELIIIDDCSYDKSVDIVKKYQEKDDRIILYRLNKNSGAAIARNKGLELAKGRFISFLDADDLWKVDKLEKQINIMKNEKYAFSCASYEVISEEGVNLNKKITMLPKVDYKGFLTNNLLQTVGIMIDRNQVENKLITMPNLRRRQDAATWLQILKSGYNCYGIEESLCFYRRVSNSLSSNKVKAVKGVWFLYRDIEKLPLLASCYYFVRYAGLAVYKRIYVKK